jgi:hypothetical protein
LTKNKPPTTLTTKSNSAIPTTKVSLVRQTNVSISTPGNNARSSILDLDAPMMTDSPQKKKIRTTVKPKILRKFLQGYDTFQTNFLLSGFTNGSSLGYQSTPESFLT